MDMSSMELVITCVLVTMALLSCLCCLCMKYSDLKMRHYIVETAKKRGVNVDMEKLDPKYIGQSPSANENCTIIVPEVAIILYWPNGEISHYSNVVNVFNSKSYCDLHSLNCSVFVPTTVFT